MKILKTAKKNTTRNRMVNIKVTEYEHYLLKLKADRISGGNISELLRYAGLNFDPQESDLVDIEPNIPKNEKG